MNAFMKNLLVLILPLTIAACRPDTGAASNDSDSESFFARQDTVAQADIVFPETRKISDFSGQVPKADLDSAIEASIAYFEEKAMYFIYPQTIALLYCINDYYQLEMVLPDLNDFGPQTPSGSIYYKYRDTYFEDRTNLDFFKSFVSGFGGDSAKFDIRDSDLRGIVLSKENFTLWATYCDLYETPVNINERIQGVFMASAKELLDYAYIIECIYVNKCADSTLINNVRNDLIFQLIHLINNPQLFEVEPCYELRYVLKTIGLLAQMGHAALIDESWIQYLMENQQENGGWLPDCDDPEAMKYTNKTLSLYALHLLVAYRQLTYGDN